MKKIICILGSAIFLVLLVLPCFGISKAESDEIWKMKVEYDQTLSGYSENGLSYIQNPFYSSVDSLAYVFLCTPTASSMKFTAVSTEEDPGVHTVFFMGAHLLWAISVFTTKHFIKFSRSIRMCRNYMQSFRLLESPKKN